MLLFMPREGATLPHLVLTVPYQTQSLLMIFSLLGRIRVAMCLPSLLELKVMSRKKNHLGSQTYCD